MTVFIEALSLHVPDEVRTNDHWRTHHPDMVAKAEERTLARIFNMESEARPEAAFDRAMVPFLKDPFRGTVERRVAGELTSVDLEVAAAQKAMDAAGFGAADVDLLISTGFLSRDIGIGNAVHVAKALGLTGAAFNMESACGGPLNALMTAHALVTAGTYDRVLVTVSCTYLQRALETDTLSWFLGDGAGAFIVGKTKGAVLRGGYAMHSADTCGTWRYDLEPATAAERDAGHTGRITMRASPKTGPVMRASAEPHLRRCSTGVLDKLGLSMDDVDCVVTHTPTAWFRDFAADVLGVDPARMPNTYARYANMGPALTPANLYEAASTGLCKPGDTVLMFAPGSASSSVGVVFEWGDVALAC